MSAFHPNNNYLFSGSDDCTIRMWDIKEGKCVRVFNKQKNSIISLAVDPSGTLLASGCIFISFHFEYLATNGDLTIYDINSGNIIFNSKTHSSCCINSLSFSNIGNDKKLFYSFYLFSSCLASGGSDNTIRLWDIKNVHVSEPKVFYTKKTPIYKVHFGKNDLLFVGGVYED